MAARAVIGSLVALVSLLCLLSPPALAADSDPVALLIGGAPGDPSVAAARETLRNVDPWVLERMVERGRSDFFLVLVEQADLSGARKLRTKAEKGRYVFQRLREVAERTQGPLLAELEALGAKYRSFHIQNMVLVREGTFDQLLLLAAREDVAEVRGNRRYNFIEKQPLAYPAPEGRAVEWNVSHVGADMVWAEGYTGEGIVVANLDTGVDWDHPALKEHYRGWNGSEADHDYNWHACSSVCPDPSVPCDAGQHGTHTMGTIVGDDGGNNQIGVAPGAKWIACGHLEGEAEFHECFEWFLAPYRYGEFPSQGLPEKAPDVVNNSWGWPIGGGDYQYAPDIDALQAAGVFMEFSAGNEGDSCESLGSPGDYPQVLSTGASDAQDRIVSTSWTYWGSSRGPASSGIPGAPDFIKPEIVAPGYDVRSSVPGGGYEGGWGGTSMAGPHVVGAVALLWSAAPDLIGDIETTRQLLLDTAYYDPDGSYPGAGFWPQVCEGIDASDTRPNHVWGWGLLNIYAAYQQLSGVYLDREAYLPEDTIGIIVRDSSASGSVEVEISSTTEGVPEIVVCTETPSGEFEGSIPCVPVPPQSGDGVLSVQDGDVIECFYPALGKSDTAVVDGVEPQISNVTVLNVTHESATIVWGTDEPANSTVYYGVGSPTESVTDETMTTEHVVQLTGLNDCTSYLFVVESTDMAGNVAYDNNGGDYYHFTTDELFLLLEENMDEDPGWSTEGLWAWGQPLGQGGEYGQPDPTSGHTGLNVYGYNLAGDYPNNMPSTLYLTTPSFDCSEASSVQLGFWRWLGVENNYWDHASIDVSPDGGATWNSVWENGAVSLEGGSWEYVEYDLTPWAAGASAVRIRWGMGPTDTGWRFCGWNIDDVRIYYSAPCNPGTPTATPPPSATPPPAASATPSPRPTETPAPTAPPTVPPGTPTPEIPPAGMELIMADTELQAGEELYLHFYLHNPGPAPYQGDAYVVLEFSGAYWFWPSWIPMSEGIDYRTIDVPARSSYHEDVLRFVWPPGVGSASGLHFYGALFQPGTFDLIGEIQVITWSYR
jgi:subtilisin family serine protease